MKTSPQQPTPKKLQRLIPKVTKTIEQYTAKGWGDPASLQTARANLHEAQQALEAGHIDMARDRFAGAMDYLTAMAKDAVEDLMRRRYSGQPKR